MLLSLVLVVLIAPAQDTLPYVKSHSYISAENHSFINGSNHSPFRIGNGVAGIGDLDGNGSGDIALQASTGTDGKGSVFILMMNADGTVLNHHLLDSGAVAGLDLADGDGFGGRISGIGDLDSDGVNDIAVLASGDDTYATDQGAIHIVFLNSDGSAKSHKKFTKGLNGFDDSMTSDFRFGDITPVGDVNGDGVIDLVSGTHACDIGGTDRGAIRFIYMNSDGTVNGWKRITNNTSSAWPGGVSPLVDNAWFGFAVSSMGDLNGDGIDDLAVSARNQFRVYILFLDSANNVASYETVDTGDLQTSFGGVPHQYGWSLDNIGDLNADGVNDLLITARFASNAHTRDGQAVIVYLNADGSVQSDEALGEGLSAEQDSMGLHNNAWLGFQCAALGDVDGDKVMDIALTATGHDGGGGSGAKWGRLYLMYLNHSKEPQYALLEDRMTGAAYSLDQWELFFHFEDEYPFEVSDSIDYQIKNSVGQVLMASSTHPLSVDEDGQTEFRIDLRGSISPGDDYVMEVTNFEGETLYLNFN